MVTTIATEKKTFEDWLKTPEDGQRYELIDGEIIVSASPALPHQWVSFQFGAWLFNNIHAVHRGRVYSAPTDVRLDRDVLVVPDFFVAPYVEGMEPPEGPRFNGAPELIVEILSPSTGKRDLGRKRALYAEYGVKEYWIIDPIKRDLTPLSLAGGKYEPIPLVDGVFRSIALPDLVFNPIAFFGSLV